RSPAAAWHTADVGLGAGAAAAAVAAGVALGDGLLLGDEVLELQAARNSPAARAAAAMRHRPGPVTVAQIVFASPPPQAATPPAVGCPAPMPIGLPPLTQSTGLPPPPQSCHAAGGTSPRGTMCLIATLGASRRALPGRGHSR